MKTIKRYKEGHYIMVKGSIKEEDITIINVYRRTQHRSTQCVQQIWTTINGGIDRNTIVVVDFNTPLTPMDRSSKQNKETQPLSDTLDAAAAAKSLQSCPTLCDPIDGSPPGSPVPGILQARTLEWVAISFSNAWKWKVRVKSLSRVRLFPTQWTAAYQAPPSMGFFQARVLECVAIAFSNIGWNSPNWCL